MPPQTAAAMPSKCAARTPWRTLCLNEISRLQRAANFSQPPPLSLQSAPLKSQRQATADTEIDAAAAMASGTQDAAKQALTCQIN